VSHGRNFRDTGSWWTGLAAYRLKCLFKQVCV